MEEILELIIEGIADEITRDKEATSTYLNDLRRKQENIGSNPITRFDPVKDKDEIDENKSNEMPYKPIADLPRTGISQRNQREFQNNRNITISASGVKNANPSDRTPKPKVRPSISASGVKSTPKAQNPNISTNGRNITISATGVKRNGLVYSKKTEETKVYQDVKTQRTTTIEVKPTIEEKVVKPIIEEKSIIKEEPIIEAAPIIEEPKIEAKVEPKVEIKVEPKVEIKAEPKSEIKVEPTPIFNPIVEEKESKSKYEEYDERGFNIYGYHKNGTRRDNEGYDYQGFSVFGYDKDGYNKDGYNRLGYNREGFDSEGYDQDGYNKDGYNRFGGKKNK